MVSFVTIKRENWEKGFADWFRNIIERASIIDYRYPIKACGVWQPYGFKFRRNILQVIRRLLDEKGHQETLFPTLIPDYLIEKEAAHIKSFKNEAYWVTRGGNTDLAVQLALRPTSETAITPMAKLWVRSHADLPLKIYQIGSIFRYETKATKPLIRLREVSTFKEAHTFHASHEEAKVQVTNANNIYGKIFDELCVPYVISERPSWDRFAGALATYAFDTIFPDGKCLQIRANRCKATRRKFETGSLNDIGRVNQDRRAMAGVEISEGGSVKEDLVIILRSQIAPSKFAGRQPKPIGWGEHPRGYATVYVTMQETFFKVVKNPFSVKAVVGGRKTSSRDGGNDIDFIE